MPGTQFFAVVLDRGSPEEREAIQAVVKEHANGWWHRFESFWVVGGHTASWWRDQLRPSIAAGPSTLLVMKLPADESRAWAAFGPNMEERFRWMHGTYTRNPDYL